MHGRLHLPHCARISQARLAAPQRVSKMTSFMRIHEQLSLLSESYTTNVPFKAWSQVVAAALRWSNVTAVNLLRAWPSVMRSMKDKVSTALQRPHALSLPVTKVPV